MINYRPVVSWRASAGLALYYSSPSLVHPPLIIQCDEGFIKVKRWREGAHGGGELMSNMTPQLLKYLLNTAGWMQASAHIWWWHVWTLKSSWCCECGASVGLCQTLEASAGLRRPAESSGGLPSAKCWLHSLE